MSDEPKAPPPAKRRKPRGQLGGDSLGGMMVGFDQQIMRTLPPPHELVQKGSPVRGMSGEGDDLVIVLPGVAAEPAEPAAEAGSEPVPSERGEDPPTG